MEGQYKMARKPLTQLPDWELVDKEDDIRGHMLMDESGNRIGKVDELILDTDMGRVTEIVLDNGKRYPADRIDIRKGEPFLLTEARPQPMFRREEEMMGEEKTYPLAEERLRVRRTREKVGQVDVDIDVISHRETMRVPTSHEEVYVEEEAVTPRPAEHPIGEGKDDVISVPVYDEEITPEKETVITREVHVGKMEEEEEETVSEELRREEARIERHGDVEVHEEGEEGERGRRAA
jgi:uncharacterized protein (TIGR02271 family)